MLVLRVDFARARLADSARSEAFANEIDKLRDALAYTPGRADDRPKYGDRTVNRLAQDLVARGAGLRDALFQLAHLTRAAAAVAGRQGALGVLFALEGPARTDAIAKGLTPWFADGRAARLTETALEIPYADGGFYTLPYRRMPVVLALLDFVLGLDLEGAMAEERAEAFRGLQTAAPTKAGLAAASNAMATFLSRYLDQILGSRAARERLTAITRFLDAEAVDEGPGTPKHWTVDDEAVLRFWEDEAAKAPEDRDHAMFRTTHRSFVALLLALDDGFAWYAMHGGRADLDASPLLEGHIDAEAAGETGEDPALADGPLAALRSDPLAAVKFVNKREAEALDIVDSLYRLAPGLPLSALRTAAMGGHQNAIRAALQFKRPHAPLLTLPEAAPEPYGAARTGWQDAAAHLARMRQAAAFVLAHHTGLPIPGDALAPRRAFRAIRRQGFDDALENPAAAALFGAAIDPLVTLSELTEKLLGALPEETAKPYAADRPRFEAAFRALYQNVETA